MTDLPIARRTLLAQSGLGVATAFGTGFGPSLAEAKAGPPAATFGAKVTGPIKAA
jgi:hypothetical protein